MIQKSISVEQFIQCKVYRFAGLLQMPFRENGFAPLYPLLKSKNTNLSPPQTLRILCINLKPLNNRICTS